MKRIVAVLVGVMMLSFLTGCGEQTGSSNLEFPKTTWGMSMEETLDTYNLTKEETSDYEEGDMASSFTMEGYELFGTKSSQIIFNFLSIGESGENRLCKIDVIYPDDTDMTSILEKMEKQYGANVSEVVIYDWYQALEDSLTKIEYEESDETRIWANSTVEEKIGEEDSNQYRDLWKEYQPNLSDDN